MKKLILLTLLLQVFSIQAQAQSSLPQIGLGTVHAVLNIGKAIPNLISNSVKRKRYKRYEAQLKQEGNEPLRYRCRESFNVLALNKDQSIPLKENSLTFRNHEQRMENGEYEDIYRIKNPLGYCWGHAMVTSKFNRLAVFRPELKAPHKEGSKKWKRFYKKIIRKISIRNKAQIIPGFANLHELSSNLKLRQILANQVQNSWAKVAVTVKGFAAGLKKGNKLEEKKELNEVLQNRIERHQYPMVTMHYLGENFTETHIVILWKYLGEIEPGKHRFCSRDNNSEYILNEDCSNHLTIDLNNRTPIEYRQQKYTDIDGITYDVGVKLSYKEDLDTVKQIKSLDKLCKEKEL